MAKKCKKMYNVVKVKSKKEKLNESITINRNSMLINCSGKLNRNDGIVKTGTGVWENKKRKHINKRYKKEISDYYRVLTLRVV